MGVAVFESPEQREKVTPIRVSQRIFHKEDRMKVKTPMRATAVAAVLVLGLAACGGGSENEPEGGALRHLFDLMRSTREFESAEGRVRERGLGHPAQDRRDGVDDDRAFRRPACFAKHTDKCARDLSSAGVSVDVLANR